MSDTRPMKVMLTAYDTKYPVTTQPATSSFWISIVIDRITSGRTAETMVRSSAPMKTGRQTSARISRGYCCGRDIQPCGLLEGDGGRFGGGMWTGSLAPER